MQHQQQPKPGAAVTDRTRVTLFLRTLTLLYLSVLSCFCIFVHLRPLCTTAFVPRLVHWCHCRPFCLRRRPLTPRAVKSSATLQVLYLLRTGCDKRPNPQRAIHLPNLYSSSLQFSRCSVDYTHWTCSYPPSLSAVDSIHPAPNIVCISERP